VVSRREKNIDSPSRGEFTSRTADDGVSLVEHRKLD
jgi:hypothetical protein